MFTRKNYMKKTIFFLTLAVLLILTVVFCSSEPADDNNIINGPTHFYSLKFESEQVWNPNYSTGHLSNALYKFTGDRVVDVLLLSLSGFETITSGYIKNGLLTINPDKLQDNELINSDDLLRYCFDIHESGWSGGWYSDGSIEISPAATKGNIITIVTDKNEGLIKEGFSGTSSSLSSEYIYYIYVDTKCIITANQVKYNTFGYTFNKLNLSLEAGWNTLCKKEIYTIEGNSYYSMEVINPGLRWVMLPLPQ